MRRLVAGVAVATMLGLSAVPAQAAVVAPGPPGSPEWWFAKWNVPTLWAEGADGHGILIGEIDTGVSPLPELAGKLLPGTDLGPDGGNGQTDHDVAGFGHGTAMASIMVGSVGPFDIEGLAPQAKVLPIAIPLQGTDDAQPDDDLSTAVRYAVDHGAKIINLSVGASRNPNEDPQPCPSDEQLAVAYAISKGAIVVSAAGNDGANGNPVEEPGVCIGVISVAAVDSTLTVASFSSHRPYVTVNAPGVNVPSLGRIVGTGYTGEGTSQAAALTSASLALIWSKRPHLTNQQVVALLMSTLDDRHTPHDPSYGYGFIDPGNAVSAPVPTEPSAVLTAAAPYIALERAVDAHPAHGPGGVSVAPTAPGTFAVGSQPSRLTSSVIEWGVLALLGLVATILLVVRRPRRSGRHTAAPGDAALYQPMSEPLPPAPPSEPPPSYPVEGADHPTQ